MEFNTDIVLHAIEYTLKLIEGLAPRLIFAILTLLIGWIIIKWINHVALRALKHARLDQAVRSFLGSLISIGLKIVLLIIVASMLGVQTSSLVALVGAAGLAIGLALQGSLANFAGGVLILIFKPFKIGDYIEAQGFVGTVESIQIFNTTLKTTDNQAIVIPNGKLSNDCIRNYTAKRTRRVDLTLHLHYDEDLKKVRKNLLALAKKEKRFLDKPTPEIVVKDLTERGVEISLRGWVKTKDYWDVYYGMLEVIQEAFRQEKIELRDVFAFPQN